jgi:hypothetical protein
MTIRASSFFEALLFGTAGLVITTLFTSAIYLPLNLAVLAFFAFALWGLATARASQFAILERLMIVLYTLPFSVTLGYLFQSDYVWRFSGRAYALLRDDLLVLQMVTVGLVGLLGLLTGMKMGEVFYRRQRLIAEEPISASRRHSLGAMPFVGLLAFAFALSWAAAPSETILTSVYASPDTVFRGQRFNFNAGDLISYLLLVLLFVDAEHDVPSRRKWKTRSVVLITILITIFLQVLRGDRAVIALIAALMALYITAPSGGLTEGVSRFVVRSRQNRVWKRLGRLVVPGTVIVVVFIALGSARFTLAGGARDERSALYYLRNGFENNTWTAVLLTNLGMAEIYRYSLQGYLNGETYLDYLRSLPPGVVTAALGLERPLERDSGPNWWFAGLSTGGMHPAVVPFMNFGIWGTFVVLALYGAVIARWDNPNQTRWRRYLFGAVIASSFKWFWYGDMNIIRGVMGAILLWMMYRVLVSARHYRYPVAPGRVSARTH